MDERKDQSPCKGTPEMLAFMLEKCRVPAWRVLSISRKFCQLTGECVQLLQLFLELLWIARRLTAADAGTSVLNPLLGELHRKIRRT